MSRVRAFVDRAREVALIDVLVRAYVKSKRDGAADLAASIAFFSLFSIFPLLLVVVAIGSRFFEPAELRDRIGGLLDGAFPAGGSVVTQNIDTLYRLSGTAGVISAMILLWSASKMTGAVSRALDHALTEGRSRAFYVYTARNIAITIVVSLSMFCVVAFSTTLEILTHFDVARLGIDLEGPLGFGLRQLGGLFVSLTVLVIVYKSVPYRRPRLMDALFGAAIAAILFETGKFAFVLYIRFSSRLEAIYGSVTAIALLLLWLFYSARVLVYGAEVISVREKGRTGASPSDSS